MRSFRWNHQNLPKSLHFGSNLKKTATKCKNNYPFSSTVELLQIEENLYIIIFHSVVGYDKKTAEN